jgi:hypothetical protein
LAAGEKQLVFALYSSQSGRPAYFFSKRGTPETKAAARYGEGADDHPQIHPGWNGHHPDAPPLYRFAKIFGVRV